MAKKKGKDEKVVRFTVPFDITSGYCDVVVEMNISGFKDRESLEDAVIEKAYRQIDDDLYDFPGEIMYSDTGEIYTDSAEGIDELL